MRLLFCTVLILVLTSPLAQAVEEPSMIGINLAGAEFAGHELPGKEGTHYGWPNEECMEYWHLAGIRLVRLPFKWERLQPKLLGDLDPAYAAGLARTVKLLEDRNMLVFLDIHNYGKFYGQPIGSEDVPVAAFADLWTKIADSYKDSRAVCGYGLMNEPTRDCDWPGAVQAAIDGIRSVDKRTMILVANDYPGWAATVAAKRHANDLAGWAEKGMRIPDPKTLHDPSNNLRFEVHTYFDHDNSGTYRKTYAEELARRDGPETRVGPNTGIDRLKPFAEWLKKHNAKGFVGEYSVPANPESDPRWLETLDNAVAFMKEHNLPNTYWAGGQRWSAGLSWVIERNGWSKSLPAEERAKDRPQLEILRKYMDK